MQNRKHLTKLTGHIYRTLNMMFKINTVLKVMGPLKKNQNPIAIC